jgi:choline kinase
MTSPNTVVILGAGFGSRLRPLTDDRPKCAVSLAGEPLAARVVRQFAARGVTHAVVVVGHMAERARELIGAATAGVAGLRLEFVENRDFATTNTMYSTLIAMPALEGGGYLVEGDIAASDAAIARLTGASPTRSHWAADPWTPAHSGSRLHTDAAGRIVGQEIWRTATVGDCRGLWKSAGMLKLSVPGARAMAQSLTAEANRGQTNIYYDDVVGRHLGAFDLDILDLTSAPWVEIDDLTDMAQARALFEPPEASR